jgi:tellurite methyltransferase
MLEDKQRWNKKHAVSPMPDSPVSILQNNIQQLSKSSKCLDIACGKGRHTHFLAQNNHLVDAVDYSDVALESLDRHELINPIEADLDSFTIDTNSYDLIVCTNFLSRRLFPYIKSGLKMDGLLIFETFVEYDGVNGHAPSNKEYLLRSNELLHAFIGLEILFYEEKTTRNLCGESVKVATLMAKRV